ncbi:hypothetical protein ACVIHC_002235 [Bradyrhizobium diazoefficiens]
MTDRAGIFLTTKLLRSFRGERLCHKYYREHLPDEDCAIGNSGFEVWAMLARQPGALRTTQRLDNERNEAQAVNHRWTFV